LHCVRLTFTKQKKMAESSPIPALAILYGSSTGNAEHIAKELSTSIPSKGSFYSSVLCCEMNQFKRKCQKAWDSPDFGANKHAVIVITSTTGNGDAPENAGRFVRYVKKKDTEKSMPFKNCVFSVLALGDTNYDQFCATGQLVDRKMKDLGGIRAKQISLADEGTGLEDVVEPYLETVLQDLQKAINNINSSCIDNESPVEEKKEEDCVEITTKSTSSTKEANPPKSVLHNTSMLAVKTDLSTLSPGVSAILSIAKQHNILIPEHALPKSSLPSLTASMSSCKLINKNESDNDNNKDTQTSIDDERVSIISGSTLSNGCQYTMQNPYTSSVIAGRYLTKTSTLPLSKALILSTSSSSSETNEKMVNEVITGFDVNLNPKDAKRVIELTLGLPEDYSLEYEPGDSIGIMVNNELTSSFRSIISVLEQKSKMDFGATKKVNAREQLVSVDDGEPISIYEAISKCVDITSIVKKRILARLAHLCNIEDNQESVVLSLLSSKTPEGETLYKEFVEKYALNIGHILKLFPSCQPNVQDILGICDGMAPRYYSISSSPLKEKDQLTIAFSVVDYIVTKDDDVHPAMKDIVLNRRAGLATQFLEIHCASLLCKSSSFSAHVTLSIFPKPTTDFRLPKSTATPLILVGPGTGVAPFLGFLSHRECLLKEKEQIEAQAEQGTWRGGFEIDEDDTNTNKNTAENAFSGEAGERVAENSTKALLFFGCRWPDHDFLFKEELHQLVASKTLTSLHTAFSRVPNPDKNARKYVQHEMKAVGKNLVDMILHDNASVYVCGDGNAMGKDVQDCLASLLEKNCTNISDGKTYVKEMKKKHKFVLDIWS